MHDAEPTQIQWDLVVDNDNTGTASTNDDEQAHIDSNGVWSQTNSVQSEFDSGGGYDTFRFDNEGVPLVVDYWLIRVSQGAEDGRCWFKLGYDKNASSRVLDWLAPQLGVHTGGGRTRNAKVFRFPDHTRYVDTHQSLYLELAGDTDTTDTIKARASLGLRNAESVSDPVTTGGHL